MIAIVIREREVDAEAFDLMFSMFKMLIYHSSCFSRQQTNKTYCKHLKRHLKWVIPELFNSFHIFYVLKTVDFSEIQTRIVRVDANTLTF